MAYLELHRKKLQTNFNYLEKLFRENDIDWAIVTKLLCGNEDYLREVISLGIQEVCDSRISNLAMIKKINPDIATVYIKPAAQDVVPELVTYADASFNTEFKTIKWISDEAVRQGKTHKIIIMIELGDLREGVMGDNVMDFYESIFRLPNIQVTGIGANLNCLYGVMPSMDKLVQLALYKQLIEVKFRQKIPWVTGGTSVVIPLLPIKQVPRAINHFRVGEALYFGRNLFNNENIPGMEADVFRLYAQIIEITRKPIVPTGVIEENPSGEIFEIREEDYGKMTYRAILDIGRLDASEEFLIPDDKEITLSGASSDMLIIDLGENRQGYKVGDHVSFRLRYMGALGLMNSNYVTKTIVE